jgi:hypothetical protein
MSSSASLDNLARSSFPTTLPTAPVSPIAESAPPFPSSAPSSPPNANSISVFLQNGDRTLARLSKILSTPSGTDRLLATTCYTLTLLSATINATLTKNVQRVAEQFADKAAAALEPGESVIATFTTPPLTASLANLSKSSAKLAGLISDFRIFTRLWGLLGLYAWGKATYLSPPTDPVLKRIAYSQVFVNTIFQILENRAYLASKNIITRLPAQQGSDWIWSSRFWMAHVSLDFIRLYRTRVLRNKRSSEAKAGDEEAKVQIKKEESTWWREFIVDACYLPLTIHWSTDGILSQAQVGLLGTAAGATGLRHMWRQIA